MSDTGRLGAPGAADGEPQTQPDTTETTGRTRLRAGLAVLTTVLAVLLVWVGLVAPNRLSDLNWGAFVRIPIEGLVGVVVLLSVPTRARGWAAGLIGFLLGILTVLKFVDMGFYANLDRPFNPVTDRTLFGPAAGVVSDSIGHVGATVTVIAAIVLAIAVPVLMVLAVRRLARLAASRRTASLRSVTALGVVWVLCAVSGAELVSNEPIASTSASVLAYDRARDVRDAIHDEQAFKDAVAVDAFRDTPADELLTGLRGKDVLFVFVESYGRVALENDPMAPGVNAVVEDGTRRLEAAGFDSRSGWLTSPTFGAVSWLAHSTLQSGVWVENQLRYDELMDTDRFTLTTAFNRAGWRTVGDVPSNRVDWDEGTSFYGYDQLYDSRNVGYQGPTFSYSLMPDQYTLSTFERLELAPADREPVMAEIDLCSSHNPWAPLPALIDWDEVGDGSVYDGVPEQGDQPEDVWKDPELVKEAYGQSIEYSLESLVSFVETYGDDDLVLVVLGDHQPVTTVSGEDAGHDVPISVIAHDPKVMDRIAGWGWDEGLRPTSAAPIWPMDSFRDRFLTAFGPRQ